jgi:hypothetical protein
MTRVINKSYILWLYSSSSRHSSWCLWLWCQAQTAAKFMLWCNALSKSCQSTRNCCCTLYFLLHLFNEWNDPESFSWSTLFACINTFSPATLCALVVDYFVGANFSFIVDNSISFCVYFCHGFFNNLQNWMIALLYTHELMSFLAILQLKKLQ